ncbi:hypothetical protein PLESTB_000456500 [Pleodorina starrii]|uniref:Uncharacterized protein n=1 Tax=Pleodorina starrii TaxID=330485 RepID=A0A9W6EZQ3_9CHLO|nr:hypothetical protein PLESTM_000758000 [Pleodorina starrii]GLC51012.1 hypothetical protein PLESTB_000456500 [Pleodorina starrii]
MSLFCRACLSTSLSLINSVYVCDQCGLQSQLVEEDNDAEMITYARRKHGGTGTSVATMEQRAAEAQRHQAELAAKAAAPKIVRLVPYEEHAVLAKLKAVAALYLRSLQGLVRSQADALVERFGGPPECRGLMRAIWFGFVPLTGLLDMDPRVGGTTVQAYLNGSGYPGVARQGILGDAHMGGGANLYGRAREAHGRGVVGLDRQPELERFHHQGAFAVDWGLGRADFYIRKLMPPSVCLVMTMLTCLLTRMPVSPVDIVRWTLDESLPYHDLEIRSRQLVATFPLKIASGRLLRASGSVPPRRLLVAAVEMSGVLGLQLPPLNVEGLLAALSDEMGLPRPVFLVSRELHHLYTLSSPLLHPNALGLQGVYPYLPLTALLFAAIKICYGLDGRTQAVAEEEAKARMMELRRKLRGRRGGSGSGAAAAAAAAAPADGAAAVVPQVAAPLIPGVPPLELPPGGWPAWAALRMGPLPRMRMPVTSAPLNAWEATHLPPGELRAFVAASAQRLATCSSSQGRDRNTFAWRNIQRALFRMARAAEAAEAEAEGHAPPAAAAAFAAAAAAPPPPPAAAPPPPPAPAAPSSEGGGGEGGPAAAPPGPAVWPPVAISVPGPQARPLAGIPLDHLPPAPPPSADPPPPPPPLLPPRPPRSSGTKLLPWRVDGLVQQGLQMHCDSAAVLGMLAWRQSLTAEDVMAWTQSLLVEMAEVDRLARAKLQRAAAKGLTAAEAAQAAAAEAEAAAAEDAEADHRHRQWLAGVSGGAGEAPGRSEDGNDYDDIEDDDDDEMEEEKEGEGEEGVGAGRSSSRRRGRRSSTKGLKPGRVRDGGKGKGKGRGRGRKQLDSQPPKGGQDRELAAVVAKEFKRSEGGDGAGGEEWSEHDESDDGLFLPPSARALEGGAAREGAPHRAAAAKAKARISAAAAGDAPGAGPEMEEESSSSSGREGDGDGDGGAGGVERAAKRPRGAEGDGDAAAVTPAPRRGRGRPPGSGRGCGRPPGSAAGRSAGRGGRGHGGGDGGGDGGGGQADGDGGNGGGGGDVESSSDESSESSESRGGGSDDSWGPASRRRRSSATARRRNRTPGSGRGRVRPPGSAAGRSAGRSGRGRGRDEVPEVIVISDSDDDNVGQEDRGPDAQELAELVASSGGEDSGKDDDDKKGEEEKEEEVERQDEQQEEQQEEEEDEAEEEEEDRGRGWMEDRPGRATAARGGSSGGWRGREGQQQQQQRPMRPRAEAAAAGDGVTGGGGASTSSGSSSSGDESSSSGNESSSSGDGDRGGGGGGGGGNGGGGEGASSGDDGSNSSSSSDEEEDGDGLRAGAVDEEEDAMDWGEGDEDREEEEENVLSAIRAAADRKKKQQQQR